MERADSAPKGVIEVVTSRGKILIRDDHVFEITVPQAPELHLMFHGDSTVFRVGGWLDCAKQFGHNGKLLDKPPHLMHNEAPTPGGPIV